MYADSSRSSPRLMESTIHCGWTYFLPGTILAGSFPRSQIWWVIRGSDSEYGEGPAVGSVERLETLKERRRKVKASTGVSREM